MAYTPTPPTPAAGPDNGYFFFETDTGLTYSWDGAVWVQTGGGGATSVTAAGTLTANAIVLGAGAKTVAALGSLGTTTTVLHGNAAGAPTYGPVVLTTDVSGDLPFANLAQGTALSVLGVTGNATADNASIVAASDHQVVRRSGTAVAFGAVNIAQSAAVTGTLPVGNGGTGITTPYVLRVATLNILNADIKKLPSVAQTIVAAPGANLRIKVVSVSYRLIATTATYTGIDTGYAALQLSYGTSAGPYAANPVTNDSGATMTTLTDFMAGSTHDCIMDIGCPFMVNYGTTSGYITSFPTATITSQADKAIVLNLDNNGSPTDLGGGDASQNLFVTCGYYLEATA